MVKLLMYYTDNPVMDAERHMQDQDEQLEKLPVCECCGEPIQQEKAVYYNDQWCCEDCEDEFWRSIREDFLERTDPNG